jgi:spatacsin
LQGLVCKIGHGVVHAQRIALIYRVSLFLNRNFVDLIKMKDAFELLELAASSECENKLLVMNDIMVASEMSNEEIAEFVAKEISASIIRTRFLQFNKDTELMIGSVSLSPTREVMDELWGYSLSKDLHLILELCTSTTLLGNYLLKYYQIFSKESADIPFQSDNMDHERICQHLNRMLSPQVLSLKKRNIIRVELLITAHECFAHESLSEGIGLILNLAKSLCNHLAAKKSFTLIVKLLCGIGRYREMFYCFEILIKNDQFEALLGQFTDKQTNGLKMAILNYLNENHHPGNKDYYRMAASHFMMYAELANIWRRDCLEKIQSIIKHHQIMVVKTGRINSNQLQQLDIPYLKKLDKDVITGLNEALSAMIHGAELMAMQQKTDMAIKFSYYCELIAMQMNLAKVGLELEEKMCPCVINQEPNAEKFQFFANYELSVAQSMILEKNTELKIDFSKAIFVHLLSEDENYLQDYISRLEITDGKWIHCCCFF